MNKLLLCLMFVLPISANAACQCDDDTDDYGDPLPYREYSYFGLKGGSSDLGLTTATKASNSIGIYYGHRYTKNFATEAEYNFLGAYNDPLNASSGHVTALSLSALHHFDFTNSISLYGKLGLGYTTATTSPVAGKSLGELSYGFGFDFKVDQSMMIRIANDYYKVSYPASARAINTHIGFATLF